MLEVRLRVFKGEKMLYGSSEELGIFTQGKSWNSLMKNIREVIECYFNITAADAVRIMLDIDPAMTDNAETASC
jgi:predicted RNase H-like HicB family nuclease